MEVFGKYCSTMVRQWVGHSIFLSIIFMIFVGSYASAESMNSAVKFAVTTNPTGLAARSDARATANELMEQRGQYRPQVSLFGDIGAESIDNANVLSAEDNGEIRPSRQIGITSSLTLFDGYRRANTIYRNAARLDASVYRSLAASETVALSAVEAYVDVVRHRNLLAIAKRNVTRHRAILNQARARLQGGKSPASDFLQVEERVLAAQLVESEITKALADANSRYSEIIGRAPQGSMSVTSVSNLPRSRSALVDGSIDNNYEIKTSEKAIKEAEYEFDISRGDRLPRLSLEGSASIGGGRSGTPGVERQAFVGLRLSWQLYNGGARKFRETALVEREGQAAFQRDIALRNVKALAERTWNSYSDAIKRSSLLAKQVRANSKIINQYREEFNLSKRSLLDVLDAERASFNAKFQQVSIEATVQFGRFRMLAVQSKLTDYFGIKADPTLAKPNFEERVLESPREIFNINIEPLR